MLSTLLKRSFLLSIPALLAGLAAQAQPEPIKFGKIDPKDLTAAPFVADSAAEAVVLCDYATSRIEAAATGHLQTLFERTARIKILKKSGFDWATVEVSLHGSTEKMVGLRGFTYSMVSESYYSLPDWRFQESIPVRWSEYRISYPEYFDFKTVMQGYLPVSLREQSEGSTLIGRESVRTYRYRWAMKNIPAFVPEPFITTARDYLARIDFELASVHFPTGLGFNQGVTLDWARFDRMMLEDEDFGLQLDRGGFLKEALAKIPATGTVEQRVAAVHALVQAAVKYNDNDGVYTTASLRKTYGELHRGNSADVNLLLIAALRAAKIEANPVLLSTRDHGRLNSALPQVSKFNYVVAHVLLSNGQFLLVDATEPLLPSGMLPERCLSETGRLILKEPAESRWIEIKPSQRRVH